MQRALRTILKESRFQALARELYSLYRPLRQEVVQMISKRDKKLIEHYLCKNLIRKLHIGCGKHIIEGWLNSDFFPKSPHVIHVDATKQYPFDDNTFDYIFSEHMIEHVSYEQGHNMLKECFRVLKPGGNIRISTPDLQFLISLYDKKSELQRRYMAWSIEAHNIIGSVPHFEDTFVINNFVRGFGHLFIYDEKVLRYSLETAGFKDITRCDLNESEDDMLLNLENEKRMPEGFLRLETFTLQGRKSRQLYHSGNNKA